MLHVEFFTQHISTLMGKGFLFVLFGMLETSLSSGTCHPGLHVVRMVASNPGSFAGNQMARVV